MKALMILSLIGLISCGKNSSDNSKKKSIDELTPITTVDNLQEISGFSTIDTMIELEILRENQDPNRFYAELDKIYEINCYEKCEITRREK